jgi:hypothetical protein
MKAMSRSLPAAVAFVLIAGALVALGAQSAHDVETTTAVMTTIQAPAATQGALSTQSPTRVITTTTNIGTATPGSSGAGNHTRVITSLSSR